MSKQIKIGLDKVPAPVTKQFTQLVDIEGTRLFDAAGNPLVTEEEAALVQFTSTENALSVFVNNDSVRTIPIKEQFAQTSQVSSSLLGIPRAEEQLALFSDVATYGLDEDQWNEYTFSDQRTPSAWHRKENPEYGRRELPSFNEGSTEQALYLKAFPSQYGFPQGTKEARLTDPTPSFESYMNFIALGKYLYSFFLGTSTSFVEKNFLNNDVASVVNQGLQPITPVFLQDILQFDGNGSFFDVVYGGTTEQESFDAIERWTFFFDQIVAGTAKFPPLVGSAQTDFTKTDLYRAIQNFATKCKPGGSSTIRQIAVLESKRAFRYQPGRASGFTFGARMASEPTSTSSFLEWGCANDTDEYMFQLRGSQFNIVRRSTIKLSDELLTRQGLDSSNQSDTAIFPKGIGNSNALWETVIPRSKWNGDALLGTGDSGYILSFEDVTMYKIEFSWYGAIGARFYAYIPSGNGEARWVKLHTFVIENGLGQPVLANPDFKFKYLLYTDDNANIRSPIYLYKYGSSYYVDGGDEGTIRLSTTTADTKAFSTRTPVIGILPKNYILNSKGESIRNYKKSYPSKISVSTSKRCRIDVEEVTGSPEGVHFNFSPSIFMNGRHPKSRTLDFKYAASNIIDIEQPSNPAVTGTITATIASATIVGVNTQFNTLASGSGGVDPGDNIIIDGNEYEVESVTDNLNLVLATVSTSAVSGVSTTIVKKLNPSDNYAHIIADGVYGVYVNNSYSSNSRSTNTLRRNPAYSLTVQDVRDSSKVDGSILSPENKESFTGVLTNYNTIVSSTVPISSNNFKIHFLNPRAYDSGSGASRHFAEFSVGVTPHTPIAPGGDADANKVQFEFATGQYKDFDITEFPQIEYSHNATNYNQLARAEQYEWDPSFGDRMSVDPRIPNPKGPDSGFLSTVVGKINVNSHQVTLIEDGGVDPSNGVNYTGLKKLTFASGVPGPSDSLIKFDSAGNPLSEVGAGFRGTTFFFRTTVFRPTGANAYIYVDGGNDADGNNVGQLVTNAAVGGQFFIQTKILTLTHDWQAVSFDENGSELFTDNKFVKSQAIKFNDQPFYPTFALADNARINGVVIEEISEDGLVKVHTPSFVTEDSSYNTGITIINSGSSNSTEPPASFNSDERLASCRYDTSALNPLRPGNTLYSFYVDAGKPVSVDLESVFAVDRKGVSRGLYNNKSIYFTATSLDGNQGNIEATITVKEQ